MHGKMSGRTMSPEAVRTMSSSKVRSMSPSEFEPCPISRHPSLPTKSWNLRKEINPPISLKKEELALLLLCQVSQAFFTKCFAILYSIILITVYHNLVTIVCRQLVNSTSFSISHHRGVKFCIQIVYVRTGPSSEGFHSIK